MTLTILLASAVIIFCVLLNTVSYKIGIPVLLAFIVLGMIFGTDGIIAIPFENYDFAEQICSVALIFIMFYGGFGTSWKQAKPVALKAGLLATAGVAATAALTGFFCYFFLKTGLLESLLLGAVISSTDAASVFSILRSKKLGLKESTDSMLELESGSNDPCSYMLTIIVLAVMQAGISPGAVVFMVFSQFVFGALAGVAIAALAVYMLRRFRFVTSGFDMAFVIGTALLSYSLAGIVGGNGYLSAYICGIIMGNVKIQNKKALVHFFDGITGLMQMLIFFLLGLLATPSRIPAVFFPALAIMVFLTFVARPVSVFAILAPFKCSLPQQLLVSFAGLRGAASIVFAIMATVGNGGLGYDLFHIVFCIVLLSIAFQGSLLPLCARWLHMSDSSIDVMKTFSDYSDEADLSFISVRVRKCHPWAGNPIEQLILPPETLIVLILRDEGPIIPNGQTVITENDKVILSARKFTENASVYLQEESIEPGSKWIGRSVSEYSAGSKGLIIMIIRDEKTVVPNGATVLKKDDLLVINSIAAG